VVELPRDAFTISHGGRRATLQAKDVCVLAVDPTDPAAFLGRFAPARSTGVFSGFEVGFSFTGQGDSDRGYAQLGPERNGTFLR
jgi:hypothetical protein